MPRLPSNRPKTRLNLEVSQAVRERLQRLKDETDADSLTEVIRRSLAVYELLWDQQQQGGETIVRRDGTERSVFLI